MGEGGFHSLAEAKILEGKVGRNGGLARVCALDFGESWAEGAGK